MRKTVNHKFIVHLPNPFDLKGPWVDAVLCINE